MNPLVTLPPRPPSTPYGVPWCQLLRPICAVLMATQMATGCAVVSLRTTRAPTYVWPGRSRVPWRSLWGNERRGLRGGACPGSPEPCVPGRPLPTAGPGKPPGQALQLGLLLLRSSLLQGLPGRGRLLQVPNPPAPAQGARATLGVALLPWDSPLAPWPVLPQQASGSQSFPEVPSRPPGLPTRSQTLPAPPLLGHPLP